MSEAQSSLINKMAAKPESIEIAEISKVANVCTIYTNDDIKMLNAQESSTAPKYANGKRIGVGKISTMPKKNPKLSVNTETVVDKNAEISFDNMDSLGDNAPVIFYDNDLDFDNCNLTEVIKFL